MIVSAATRYTLLMVASAILVAPFSFMISIALASDDTVQRMAFTVVPTEFHVENFARVFDDGRMGQWLLNSTIIVIFTCLGQVFVSAIVAYAFARLHARFKGLIFGVVLATMMIPAEILLVPQFVLFRNLGWIDTFLPLIVPMLFGGAYNIFLMRQFITRIPMELDEAAQLDGLGHLRIFARIVMPLMRPVLVAVAVFTFSATWGAFLGPLIYLNSENLFPLALGIQSLTTASNTGQTPPYNLAMVGAVFLTTPMILIYFFSQRYIYEAGFNAGSSAIR